MNGQIIPIVEEFRIPRIGKTISKTQEIDGLSIQKLVEILKEYLEIIKKFDVEKIVCGGTAVFRNALNSSLVVNEVKEKTGIDIVVVSPEQEALLTYLGGISNFNEFFDNDFVVIDIGGGSTEITVGNINEIKFYKSYPMGAVILKDRFFNEFPYKHKLMDVNCFLHDIFREQFMLKEKIVVGVAGTPTTIASIFHNQKIFNEKEVDKTFIRSNYLSCLIEKFYELSPEKILSNFPMIVKGREDVILPGTVILKFVLDKLNSDGLYVSTRGIRYGLIIVEIRDHINGFWTNVGLRKFISSLFG